MDGTMSLNLQSLGHDQASEALDACRQPICRVIEKEAEQSRSIKRAWTVTAELFDMPYERVRSYWHNEVRRPTAAELLRIRRAYRRWVWDRQLKLASEIEQLRAELRELGGHE